MKTLIRGEEVVYCIGSRTGILVRGAPAEKRGESFDQDRSGLHHFCFRARSREDVDAIHSFLVDELDAHIVHSPEDGEEFAPGHCWLPDQITSLVSLARRGLETDGSGVKEPAPAEASERLWRTDPTDGLRPFKQVRDEFQPGS